MLIMFYWFSLVTRSWNNQYSAGITQYHHSAVQNQMTISAYFTSEKILPSGFVRQHCYLTDRQVFHGIMPSSRVHKIPARDAFQVTPACSPTTARHSHTVHRSAQSTHYNPRVDIFSLHLCGCAAHARSSQQTRDIEPMLGQCWAAVYMAGHHWSSIGSMPRVCWEPRHFPLRHTVTSLLFPSDPISQQTRDADPMFI